jgi:hypothetical protein
MRLAVPSLFPFVCRQPLLRILRTALSVQQILLPSSRCSSGQGFSWDSWLTMMPQIHSFPLKHPCSFAQASPYSDVTVRKSFSLLWAVWRLSSISSLTLFDRSTSAIRMGLEVGVTRACVHLSRRGIGVCEPPGVSQPKATAMMWLVRIALRCPYTSVAMALLLVLQGFRGDFPQRGICRLRAIGVS